MEEKNPLTAKAREIHAELVTWVQQNAVVPEGKRIVFSLKLEDAPKVTSGYGAVSLVLNLLDIELLDVRALAMYHGSYLCPAVLSEDDVQEILGRIRPGEERERMRIFLSKGNAPTVSQTDIYDSTRSLVNQVLVGPLRNGKHYRFARLKDKSLQLWEVIPPV